MAVTLVVRHRHSYVPDTTGTQCSVRGCWGWVDDPRHVFDPIEKTPVLPAARQIGRKKRQHGRRWEDYGWCYYPPCLAAPGKPCMVSSGPGAGGKSQMPHVGRKLQEYADA